MVLGCIDLVFEWTRRALIETDTPRVKIDAGPSKCQIDDPQVSSGGGVRIPGSSVFWPHP